MFTTPIRKPFTPSRAKTSLLHGRWPCVQRHSPNLDHGALVWTVSDNVLERCRPKSTRCLQRNCADCIVVYDCPLLHRTLQVSVIPISVLGLALDDRLSLNQADWSDVLLLLDRIWCGYSCYDNLELVLYRHLACHRVIYILVVRYIVSHIDLWACIKRWEPHNIHTELLDVISLEMIPGVSPMPSSLESLKRAG